MDGKAADYKEWRARRNGIAMKLCSARSRASGGVCSCYNGDIEPDRSHFSDCRATLAATDVALQSLGVPVPPNQGD